MGRTLGANRLLARSACGKRQRGRPLNSVVRTHRKVPQEPPSQVRKAVVLLWVSLILGILGTFVQWEPLGPDLEEIRVSMWGVMAFSIGAPAVLIYFISRRQNWARILTLVLTIGGIAAYFLFPMDPPEPWTSLVMTEGVTVLDLVALYWLFSGAGAKWFTSSPVG